MGRFLLFSFMHTLNMHTLNKGIWPWRWLGCCGVIGLILSVVELRAEAQPPAYRVRRVVLDAGHGGKDPGSVGRICKEKDIALKITLKVGALIKKYIPDVEVYYTRSKDVFVELHERADFANKKKADLFISIHCNSLPSRPDVWGTETYVMGASKSDENFEVAKRENAVILLEEDAEATYQGFDPQDADSYILFSLYQRAYHDNSVNFADKVETQFRERMNLHSRGVKTEGFLVLWQTSMPSVLVETGYLTHRGEERKMKTNLHQDYIASAIFRAFRSYKKELEMP